TTEPNRPATVSESVTRLCPDSIPSHPGGRVIRPTGTSIPQTRGACNRGQPGEHPPPEDWSIRQTRVGDHRPGARPSGRAAASNCRTRSEHPPGQGNGRSTKPGAAACPTYRGNIRQTRATTTSGRTSRDGPSAIRGKHPTGRGEQPPDPREHPKPECGRSQAGLPVRRTSGPKRPASAGVPSAGTEGVLVQFTFGGILALWSGNLVYLGHALGIVGRYNMLAALAECWLTSSRFNGRKPAMMPPSTRWLRLTASVSWAQSPV